MLISKRKHRRALDVMQGVIDATRRDLTTMTQRNTKNVAENVRLFVKVCKAEDTIEELRKQNEELRQDYATLRLAYDCCEKAAKLAVQEMKAGCACAQKAA
jgi:nicotinamide riboside kinase